MKLLPRILWALLCRSFIGRHCLSDICAFFCCLKYWGITEGFRLAYPHSLGLELVTSLSIHWPIFSFSSQMCGFDKTFERQSCRVGVSPPYKTLRNYQQITIKATFVSSGQMTSSSLRPRISKTCQVYSLFKYALAPGLHVHHRRPRYPVPEP